MTQSMLWRRLDSPGHDACCLIDNGHGWQLEGTAVFRTETGAHAQLVYQVVCDRAWVSRRGCVRGLIGDQRIELTIGHGPHGLWSVNDEAVDDLEGLVDLDLAFTPATNLLALRRLALAEGSSADAPAAWLDLASRSLVALPQRYQRIAPTLYDYDAPSVPYHAQLEVTPEGFIRRYPGLWEMA
ncbi:MAG: putative glycolipid-binding domain-containing protein [Kofleriaceae bacterium]